MSDDINLASKQLAPTDDLVTKAARFGAFGWIAFFITLAALVVQNLFLLVRPNPVLASVNGEVVGQVVFDEARVRSNDQILGDLKMWVKGCTTANKNTVYEDLTVCLNHMDKALADTKVEEYQKNNYAPSVKEYGCDNTNTVFDDKKIQLQRDALGLAVKASIEGEVQCVIPGKQPLIQTFAIEVEADLVGRTTTSPLAIKVRNYWDKGA
jgi:hypothetical protein